MQLRTEGLTWQVVDETVVVLDLGGSVYLRLNGSGRTLWERLAEGCADEELVDALTERYDVDRDRAAADVAGFVAELRHRNLIES